MNAPSPQLLTAVLAGASAEGKSEDLPATSHPFNSSKGIWAAVGDSLKLQKDAPLLKSVPRGGPLPLSFAQQRLWFIQQSDPQSVAYNLSFAWRLAGSLNTSALEKSLIAIVNRHESFRSVFDNWKGEPVQMISGPPMHELKSIDLQSWPEPEQNAEIARRLAQESRQPFDLVHGPLLRTLLLRLNESEHIFLLVMHHIVCDAMSLKILFQELRVFYEAISLGRPTILPGLQIQYADFAAWQRDWLQEDTLASQLSYWREQLKGSLPMLKLPTDRTRPAEHTTIGALHHFKLPKEIVTRINQLKRETGATLFNILLSAFKALIHRYTGQEDILIGSMTANRNRSEIRDLIGFFVNTLVLRTQVTGTLTFRELLARVKEVTLGAYAHQDVPFEKLVEELKPVRESNHSPLFQVMFSFQSLPRNELELPGLQVCKVEIDNGTSKFDLTLDVNETREGIVGFFEYNTDLFDAATIQRMAHHYQNLLIGALDDPDQPLWALPMLSETERNQLLIEWNKTTRDYARSACVHQLFESQVQRSPEAVAAVIDGRILTYRELDMRADQTAVHLQHLGVGPETRVGIMMERSWEMLAGILGVLKAGAAYVPLDPGFPQDRLTFMVEDANIAVLLTQSKLQSHLVISGVRIIALDAVLANPESGSELQPDFPATMTSASPAYVIYTSGSTGKPKGVVVLHRAVVNFLTSMRECPGLDSTDRLLAITTISFDIAALEILLPLTVGARVVLATGETAMTPAALAGQIEKHGVTVMQATPTTWRMLVESGWQGNSGLKILCGGEALSSELAAKLRERCGSLWNMYGPTETTIWSAVCEVKDSKRAVPVGRPIANTQMYVLNSRLQPVPAGVEGDLYIGGEGLAWGYLNRPELTDEKFISHPFSKTPGARLYRTGDTARYLPDGNLVCTGRSDHQVKVRGFRIELGEIESILEQHAAVGAAVVVADRNIGSETRLMAYWIRKSSSEATTTGLRKHLEQRLPTYMVPSMFVELPTFPLTPNGKVDRNALPRPDTNRPDLDTGYVAPESSVEVFLTNIWREVLKHDRVGVNDNFFDLGGHSLLVMQVISRINSGLGTQIPISTLFYFPTIAQLAEQISARCVE